MFEKKITYRFLDALRHSVYGNATVTTPDGKTYDYAGSQPGVDADITLCDWRAIPALAARGDIGFAEGYRNGWWTSSNLTHVFYFGLQNEASLGRYIHGGTMAKIASQLAYLLTRNTLKGSRKNIHAHYDLGNDFYKLWLDPGMTYSSAIFEGDKEDLPTAQNRKYDRILNRLSHSGNVLEIGCGWGAFAERALATKDFTIKGLTLSEAQHAYATQRLKGNAQIALEDYRLQQGTFDNIVSIEMFEAVGETYWPVYFGKVKSLLKNGGKALIQTITISEEHFERYREGGVAIRTYIFPGGMLPSPTKFAQASRQAGLQVTDEFSFGQDYARTLEHWQENFETRLADIRSLGFDESFIRMWRFYLTSCIASFRIGRTNVMQMELRHAA